MVQAWAAGKLLKLFVDEFRCPIPVTVTARAIWELLGREVNGTLHLAGAERLSRWQIGSLIALRNPRVNPQLEPSSLKDYKGPPRSPDIALNSQRAQQWLSFPLPKFSKWLDENEPPEGAQERL
jgi:dTDP-4-dehydrorhamnose reductase